MEQLERAGFVEQIGRDHIHLSTRGYAGVGMHCVRGIAHIVTRRYEPDMLQKWGSALTRVASSLPEIVRQRLIKIGARSDTACV